MDREPSTYAFSLRSDLSELQTLGRRLESVGAELKLSKRCLFELNLALDELFTNIISYGYDDGNEHRIEVTIVADERMLNVTIADDGVAFNPVERQAPCLPHSVDECRVGGLGIHLIRNLMDEVCYRRDGQKNILTMRKKIETIPSNPNKTSA
jgi:anti-sigma regulatory factor (Ser/Thr protein kinase)